MCRSKKAVDKSSSKSLKAGATSKANKNISQSTHSVETADTTGNELEASAYALFNVTSSLSSPFIVTLQINGADVQMEVDTGVSMTLISKATFDKIWNSQTAPPLQSTGSKLRTYTGENFEVLGAANVDVSFQDQYKQLHLLVVGGKGPSLLGRDWLSHIA